MNPDADSVVWVLLRAALKTLRFILFVLLSTIGHVVCPLARWVGACSLLSFLFLALFRRDLTEILMGAGAVTIAAGLVSSGYYKLLRLVAPDGVVVVGDM